VNKATGDKVVAEAKAYSTGLSPNDFRDELARYFLEYIKQPQPHRFDFYIFTETLSNDQLWKALFDRDVTDNQKLVDFYEKLKDSVNDEVVDRLEDTEVDEFRDFAIDTHVFVEVHMMISVNKLINSRKQNGSSTNHIFTRTNQLRRKQNMRQICFR